MPHTDLIWVQLALVHRVGVFDDFDLILSKSLSIETLRTMWYRASLSNGSELMAELSRVKIIPLKASRFYMPLFGLEIYDI